MIALVTDRTQADVDAGTEKGVYRAEDLNRVESAVEELAESLGGLEEELRAYAEQKGVPWEDAFELGFEAQELELFTKTDWSQDDWPMKSQMRRYLQNIRAICGILEVPTSSLPPTMDNLTWQGANAIEETILLCADAYEALRQEKKALIDSRL